MPKGDNYIRHYVWVHHIGKQWGSGSNTVGEHLQGRSFSNNDTVWLQTDFLKGKWWSKLKCCDALILVTNIFLYTVSGRNNTSIYSWHWATVFSTSFWRSHFITHTQIQRENATNLYVVDRTDRDVNTDIVKLEKIML